MRFDDKLATILAQPLDTAEAKAAAWRQAVDVLAQLREGTGNALSDEAYDLVRHLRSEVPSAIRAEAARAIAGQRLPPEIVALIAEEPPAVSASVIGGVRLESDEWLRLLPALSPTARSLLRHRRDLSAEVLKGLASFGSSDFVIPASAEARAAFVAADPAPPVVDSALSAGETQIRDLLARITAYRESGVRPDPLPRVAQDREPGDDIEEFRFETGPDGVVLWVEGAPRGPLIGVTIATAAESVDHGVDGHAAGAYRQRAPFRDARLHVAGTGPAGGEWRISAVPFFDPRDGRFTGYRGTARRPRAGETASQTATGLYGSGLAPDSLRQLVHELRTPLNAIVGFAEMIERQLLGPAAISYRARAADIVHQGRRLLAAVDDLDMAATGEAQRHATGSFAVDAAALLTRLHAEYEPVAQERGVAVQFRIAAGLPPVAGEPVAVERMFARLLASTIGLAQQGESIVVMLDRSGLSNDVVQLAVARPRLLAGRDERALLDPGYSPDGDWPDAPVLGLGFALRLIRNLANGAGGLLEIQPDAFVLRLPARGEAALSGNG